MALVAMVTGHLLSSRAFRPNCHGNKSTPV
jgi:hypothetical protein